MTNDVTSFARNRAGVPQDPDLVRVVLHKLTADDARAAEDLAMTCAARYGTVQNPEFHHDVPVIAQELPRAVREDANRVRLADRLHAFQISGHRIDEDRLEPTPRHWRDADTEGSRPYGFLLMLYGALVGDAIGWATQQDGRIVTDVLPIAGMEDSLVSAGSTTELAWHTEDAFSPHRADHVGLLCLRSPDLTATTLAYLDERQLPGDVAEVLRQPRFHVLPDASHTSEFSATDACAGTAAFDQVDRFRREPPLVPVLDGAREAPVLRIDRDFMVAPAGDEEAGRALRVLVDLVDRSTYELPLAPGDVCFIDNRNVAHGRRPFLPRYDGRDRWLKRVNTVRDLRRTRSGRATASTRVVG